MKCLGGICVKKDDLIGTGLEGFKKFIKNFLIAVKYNNKYGLEKIVQFLQQNSIEYTESGVLTFLNQIPDENLGILLIEDEDNSHLFKFVSGSMDELEAMARFETERSST